MGVASNPHALIDRLDLLLMNGSMSVPMKNVLLKALNKRSDPVERVHLALALISVAPEYNVLK